MKANCNSKRMWAETRNRKRRSMYKNDKAYRKKINMLNRKQYRISRNGRDNKPKPAIVDLCEEGLCVLPGGKQVENMSYIDVPNLAKAIGRGVGVVYKYISKGMFPGPIVSVNGKSVYTLFEGQAILTALDRHDCARYYLRRDHHDAISDIWDEVRNARKVIKELERTG